MSKKRKIHSPATKAKAALEAIQGHCTINELAGKYGVHPTQLSTWKKHLVTESKELFTDKRRRSAIRKESKKPLGCMKKSVA